MSKAKWIELNNMVKTKDEYGAYRLDKDLEAVRSYFVDYVNKKTVFFHDLKEKLGFLVENEYYDKEVLDQYTFEQVKEVFKLAYSYKFRFKSYMAAVKFYQSYALKTNDKENFLERYEDRIAITALTMAKGDFEKAKGYVTTLMNQEFQPATPVFLNAGRKRSGKQVSCFIINTDDSTEGIMYMEHAAAQLSRMGGGVGINGTDLRAAGDPIKEVEGAAGGPVGVAKMAENIFTYFDQLGQREGSGVFYLHALHYNIDEMLDTKKINADDDERLKSLSLGVLIPDILFQKAKNNEKIYVFSPYYIEKEYGVKLSEINMNDWYETLAANPNIRKQQKDARKLLTKIAAMQQESGYPYLIFIDNANRAHHLKAIGKIKCSNLCVEIFQIQEGSKINHYGNDEHEFGADISCVLGSVNIVNLMESGDFDRVIGHAVEILNGVVDRNIIEEVPTVKNGNLWYKSIGIGAMNLHGFLAKNFIKYSDTVHTIDFVRTFFSTVRYWAIYHSMRMAKETGEKFKGFEKSEYYTGEVFKPYIEESHAPRTERVRKLFEHINIPTQEDWKKLWEQVREHGMRNAYLMAIAPTGSISYIQNATPSVLPITELIETRTYGDLTTHYPMPFLKEAYFTYLNDTAYDIDPKKVIDVIAEIQKHVDQGISMTLFVKSTATTRDLVKYYIHAWKNGLKSIYYLRTKLMNEAEECESCVV
jgi:ribonucleoside-diphosphate reductase alpha chain